MSEPRDANTIVDDLVSIRKMQLALRAEMDDYQARLDGLAQRDRTLRDLERRAKYDLEDLVSRLTVPRVTGAPWTPPADDELDAA